MPVRRLRWPRSRTLSIWYRTYTFCPPSKTQIRHLHVSNGAFSAKEHGDITPVRLTDLERAAQCPSATNLQLSLTQFHKNGIAIIENAVAHSSLDHIRERMLQDLPRNLASPQVHYNHGKTHRNVSQTPPLLVGYLHEDVWANRIAVTLIEHIIGPKPQLSFATSNIALPGGRGRQAVHSDYYCEHLDFPVFLELCVFLDAVDHSNGSTEIWPGTHHGYTKKDHTHADMGWIKKGVFERRAQICPPVQPVVPKGSVCVRDLRMWHAGMPNHTANPRIMLGFIFSPAWFASRMRLRLPKKARALARSWNHVDCVCEAESVEDDMDYLDFAQEMNLTQKERDWKGRYVSKHGSISAGSDDYWVPLEGAPTSTQ
jgi:ectoine hydroxylase-related dioxygenase (phytanoyl-CoA dioxygenase family)